MNKDLLCDIDIVAVLDSQDVQLNVSEHLVPKIAPGIKSWNFWV